eukprot:scaffold235430_cov23-Tisochrysis_lutea.AAC.1
MSPAAPELGRRARAEAPSKPAPKPLPSSPNWLTGAVLPSEVGAPPAVLDFIANVPSVHFDLDFGNGGGVSGGCGKGGYGGWRGGGDGDDSYGSSAPGMTPREGESHWAWLEGLEAEVKFCIRLLAIGIGFTVAATNVVMRSRRKMLESGKELSATTL